MSEQGSAFGLSKFDRVRHPFPVHIALLALILWGFAGAAEAQTYAADRARADKLLEDQDVERAITAFEQLVNDYPERSEALNGLGFALYLEGRFDEALARFEQALEKNPDDDAAKRNLILAGGRRALESSYRDGLARIEGLKDRFPGHPQLAVLDFYAGKLHYLYGFSEPAFRIWDRVAKLRPDSGTALFLKAVEARERGDAKQQDAYFQEALQKMPEEEVFRMWAARLMIEAGQPEQAATVLEPLNRRYVLSPGVAIALSRFERMRGRTLEAYENLRRTAEVPEVLLERSLIARQMGASSESAQQELQRALDAGGQGALLVLSDEPGARVYLDGTLLGSPPLGLYPSEGEHRLRLVYHPRPILVSRFHTPKEGVLLIQAGAGTGLDQRVFPNRAADLFGQHRSPRNLLLSALLRTPDLAEPDDRAHPSSRRP